MERNEACHRVGLGQSEAEALAHNMAKQLWVVRGR
jgi:hypothetical protein